MPRQNHYETKINGKNATGRPPRYANEDELQRAVDAYFATHPNCACGQPPTKPGLALALGFDTATDLMHYCLDDFPEYAHIYKNTMTRLQEILTTDMIYGGKDYATGLIFCMCNWFRANSRGVDDYQNPQRIEITGEGGGVLKIEHFGNALKKVYGCQDNGCQDK